MATDERRRGLREAPQGGARNPPEVVDTDYDVLAPMLCETDRSLDASDDDDLELESSDDDGACSEDNNKGRWEL